MGYCGNEIWNESRKAEVEVLIAERLAAFSKMYGGEAFENDLDKAWKDLLLAQHHDIQIVGLIPEARKLLPRSYETSNQVIEKSMNFFANQMKEKDLNKLQSLILFHGSILLGLWLTFLFIKVRLRILS